MDIDRNQKIARQVERWDLYARLTPTLFLVTSMILFVFDLVNQRTIAYVGLTGFAFTAVVWWWWAIFTIKYLVTTLNRASKNLSEVTEEIKLVTEEVQDLRNGE